MVTHLKGLTHVLVCDLKNMWFWMQLYWIPSATTYCTVFMFHRDNCHILPTECLPFVSLHCVLPLIEENPCVGWWPTLTSVMSSNAAIILILIVLTTFLTGVPLSNWLLQRQTFWQQLTSNYTWLPTISDFRQCVTSNYTLQDNQHWVTLRLYDLPGGYCVTGLQYSTRPGRKS